MGETTTGDTSTWSHRLFRRLEKLGRAYVSLYSLLEGPELEPRILHSHYLSVRALRAFERDVKGKITGQVLDVGAGTGYGACLLGENAVYYPTDTPAARDYRDSSLSKRGVPLAKQCNVYEIAYEDNRFDACLALNLFEHLEEPDRALNEVGRVVKNGGLILILTPFCFPVHGYPKDYWRWTEEGLKQLFRTHGVEVLESRAYGKTAHALALNINLFLREGLFLKGYAPNHIRSVLFILLRPVMMVAFLAFNLIGLIVGTFDRSKTSAIYIYCLGKNRK